MDQPFCKGHTSCLLVEFMSSTVFTSVFVVDIQHAVIKMPYISDIRLEKQFRAKFGENRTRLQPRNAISSFAMFTSHKGSSPSRIDSQFTEGRHVVCRQYECINGNNVSVQRLGSSVASPNRCKHIQQVKSNELLLLLDDGIDTRAHSRSVHYPSKKPKRSCQEHCSNESKHFNAL